MQADLEDVRSRLLAWYDAHQRKLPWRGQRDPYAVWVSEVMLQQTRVESVRPRYAAWMQRFPTVRALAEANEEEVLAMWSGLGYYRRARSLWRGARQVLEDHDGRLPEDAAALRAIQGIGQYTACAIASIAHGKPVAAVDGNAVRVWARWGGVREEVDRAPGRRAVERLAASALDPQRPGDWNQAVMDLGATVCTPRRPQCGACPLSFDCKARAQGRQEGLPVMRPRRTPVAERRVFARIRDGGRVLLVQEPGEGLLGGLWRLPGGKAGEALAQQVLRETGLRVHVQEDCRRARHAFTHRVWEMVVHDARPGPAVQEPALPVIWAAVDDLPALGISTATRKALDA